MAKFLYCKKKEVIISISRVREICSQCNCSQLTKIKKRKWPRGIRRENGWQIVNLVGVIDQKGGKCHHKKHKNGSLFLAIQVL